MNLADTQSDLTWRKRKLCNGDNLNAEFMGLTAVKQPKFTTSAPFYYILAKESPPRAADTESEDSIYDNYHNCETDYCRDTSDTDSYTTDGIATVEVLEYEVATSSASEHMYTNDSSSSGTDDFVARAVASAIFDSSSGSDKLDLLADTEESDGPTDPELGRADYWTCVKCKNKQNNPMYRYCEKCYQIRKNYFPPRPKHRKTRSRNTMKQSPTSRSAILSSTDDEDDDNEGRSFHGGNETNGKSVVSRKSKKRSILSSPTATMHKNLSKGNSAGESSQSDDINYIVRDSLKRKIASKSYSPKIQRVDKVQSDLTGCTILENKMLTNGYMCERNSDTELLNGKSMVKPPTQLNLNRFKDSGFSSCSSQALSPDALFAKDLCSSQETYCSEFESIPIKSSESQESSEHIFSLNSDIISGESSTLDIIKSQSSNLSEVSITTVASTCTSCSEQYSKDSLITLGDVAAEIAEKCHSCLVTEKPQVESPKKTKKLDSGGLCMMCLAKPKNAVFVHSRVAHLCCCYPCAVKIWNKRKQCPVCNGKVKNVLKLFVH